MPIRTTNQGGEFEIAPQGAHVARCCKIIDLGTHEDPKFKKKRHLAWIFWELPNTQQERASAGGDPFVVGNRYTLSHNEKATLRQHLESWYGRQFDDRQLDEAGGFDLERLLGRPALLNIVHSQDGKYANVRAVMPLPRGTECPPAATTPILFSLSPYDPVAFEELSDGMKEFIRGSEEWQAEVNGHRPAGAPAGAGAQPAADDDNPFGPASARAPVHQAAGGARKPAGKFDDMEDDIPFLLFDTSTDLTYDTRVSRAMWRTRRGREGVHFLRKIENAV